MSTISSSTIDTIIARQKPGYTLEQCFYKDPEIFRRDMERVVTRLWLLVDHVSRIPNPGDYFIFEVACDEIIIVRNTDNAIHAFFNTCRHRGSKICLMKEGNVRSFTCPYHAWNYTLSGSLRGAPGMNSQFNKSTNSLYECHLQVYEGLIFICLSQDSPPEFYEYVKRMQPFMDLHDLGNAKVAHRHKWRLRSNWKLVVENFFECYHCIPAHPELMHVHSKAKYRAFGSGASSAQPEALSNFEPELKAWRENAQDLGYEIGIWGDNEMSPWLQGAQRLPINFTADIESETKSGKLASKLMGKFKECDGGTTAVTFNPLGTLLMPNDYAAVFRFTPITADITDVETVWLVDSRAEENRDYKRDEISWLWYRTTDEDGMIIENNQAGVMSSRYRPGPYSEYEEGLKVFGKWYLRLVG